MRLLPHLSESKELCVGSFIYFFRGGFRIVAAEFGSDC